MDHRLNNRQKTIAETVLNVLALALLFFVMFKNFSLDDMPALMNDEFGYWGNATVLAGWDWKALIEQTPYYSNGYSFIIFLLMKIMGSSAPSAIYQASIITNFVFTGISYCCAYYCCRTLFNKDFCKAVPTALAAIFISANLFYLHLSWPEAMITMFMWVITALVFSCSRNFTWVKAGFSILALLAMYITHQRALGAVASLVLTLALLMIKNKKKPWLFIGVLAGVAVIFGAHILLDKIFVHDVNVTDATSSNLLGKDSGTISKYWYLITANVPLMTYSFLGKLFYMGIATLGLFMVPIAGFGSDVIALLKALKRKEKVEITGEFVMEFFVVASFVLMVLMNTVQTDGAYRKDLIVYSRYMEYTIGPYMIFAIYRIARYRNKYRFWVLGTMVFIIACSFLIKYRFDTVEAGFSLYCSPLVGSFFQLCKQEATIVPFLCVILVAYFLVLFTSITSLKKDAAVIASLAVVMLLANYFTYSYANDWLQKNRNHYHRMTDPICEKINEYPDDLEIYFIKDDENFKYSTFPKYLQFLLKERGIKVIEDKKELPAQGEYFVLTNTQKDNKYYNGKAAAKTSLLELFVVSG